MKVTLFIYLFIFVYLTSKVSVKNAKVKVVRMQ